MHLTLWHMLESKLKDITKYIWVEEICHSWAGILSENQQKYSITIKDVTLSEHGVSQYGRVGAKLTKIFDSKKT